MGQDREFNEDEVKFALRKTQFYRDVWEKIETSNLREDIEKRVAHIEPDRFYRETLEQLDTAELEKLVEEQTAPKEGDNLTEEQKLALQRKIKFQLLTKGFYSPDDALAHRTKIEKERIRTSGNKSAEEAAKDDAMDASKYIPLVPEQWRQKLQDFREYHVIKMPRVFQTLFYLLGFEREEICERDTNKLDFKVCKQHLNDQLFYKMGLYNPFGPKDGDFKDYQKMKFLKKNLESYDEEKVDDYSVVLGRLFRWLNFAIEVRCEDVVARRDHKEMLKKERADAIAADQERSAKLEEQLTAAKDSFNEKVDAELAAAAEEEGEDGAEEKEQKDRPVFNEE